MSEIGGIKGQWMFPLQSERLTPSTANSSALSNPEGIKPPGASQSSASFLDTLKSALHEVNEVQVSADTAMKSMASGKATNLHEVMIAMEKADVTLRTATAIRNKMVEAYNEVLRMQV